MTPDYKRILSEIQIETQRHSYTGEVANYIPELGKVNPDQFGMCLYTLSGDCYEIGQSKTKFSIQSIAKAFSLAMAYQQMGGKLWARVGVEPSGTPFNSLVQLEHENGKPRNPFLNSGALVICDVLLDLLENPITDLIHFVRKITSNDEINFSPTVVESELNSGHRNAALIHFMKSYNNINNEVAEVLNFYCHLCAIEMSCVELAQTFLLFANRGKIISSGETILTSSQTKRINAIMQTCGFYDEAGEFAFYVGLPGKSGVGGGIAAVHPGQYATAVWSPRLNPKGNSTVGMKALELLTTKSGLSIF